MVPPPPPQPRLLLVALVGLLSLCEVRVSAPGKALAGGPQKALCHNFVLEGVARARGFRGPSIRLRPISCNRKGGALAEAKAQLLDLDPQVVAEPAEEAGTHCPEGLWPLPPQVLPRVTYTQVRQGQVEGITFFYHPCAHPWLKLQLALLAHVCVAKPVLIPDSNLTWDRPLVLTAWGATLELAWIEPAWVAHWLRRRRRRKQRKSVWLLSDALSGPTSMMLASSRGKLCGRRCVQAPPLAFALRSWRPPGVEVTSEGPKRPSLSVVKRRGLRAALGLQSTPSALRVSLASSQSLKAEQPTLGTSSVAPVSFVSGGPGGNVRGPTPRTEEAAWAAMALTFLLVLLTLATLCTRLHRNFRRSESIYWGPTADSQDTVAAVLKRRLPLPSRRIKRSRRRPLLPPTADSGPDSESSD